MRLQRTIVQGMFGMLNGPPPSGVGGSDCDFQIDDRVLQYPSVFRRREIHLFSPHPGLQRWNHQEPEPVRTELRCRQFQRSSIEPRDSQVHIQAVAA